MAPHTSKLYSIYSYHKMPHLMMMMSIVFMMTSLYLFQSGSSFIIEWELLTINSASISFPLLLEAESLLFMFTVSFISFNVLIFSKVYMMSDLNLQRFTQMVMMFIASMMMMILTPNVMTMLLGWDGLGVTSFLLVIYYNNPRSLKSGFITLMTNRVGDCLILALIAIMLNQGHWNLFNTWVDEEKMGSLIATLIVVAAITKSAQFPFMAWLTCAMAAPTPVSALVHSSTLVTAGIFMMIRFYPTMGQFIQFNLLLTGLGCTTMICSAYWAITKKDMKEVVALSTMSQLGLMTATLSAGLVELCFFHMITHAMFKATMFMSVGMNIMFKNHAQNFTNIRGKTYSSAMAIAMAVSILSMNAMFFTAGYYSKDVILEIIWSDPFCGIFSTLAFFYATMFTMTYSTRLWRMTFSTKAKYRLFCFSNMRLNLKKTSMMNNKVEMMEFPLLMMTIASITSGAMVFWLVSANSETAVVPTMIQVLPPLCVLSGLFTALSFCPSNKAKEPARSIFKIKNKYLFKGFNTIKKMLPYNIKLVTTSNYMKVKMNLSRLMNNTPKKQIMIQKQALIVTMNRLSFRPQRSDWSKWLVIQTYRLASYFLKLSLLIEQTLDMGMFTFFGPKNLSMSSTKLSKNTTMLEMVSLNTLLLCMLFMGVMINLYYISMW